MGALIIAAWAFGIFIASNTLFDAVHYFLHQWRYSDVPILRTFSAMHQVHHDFLDKQMRIHPELAIRNIWSHLVPEYCTTIAGASLFFVVAPWQSVCAILLLHTLLFGVRLREEGIDNYHMQMDRIAGLGGSFLVRPAYHAMHHVNPRSNYASTFSLFDLIFGTAANFDGKRVVITGATGAFGKAMSRWMERHGAKVTEWDARLAPELIDWRNVNLLILAHGSNGADAWQANYFSTITLGDAFIEAAKDRLVAPEIWAVGSESEFYDPSPYGASKRALARYGRLWTREGVTYRHIVPAAYRSRMGWSPVPASWVVALTMFLIQRGFRYVPVTWSGIAYLNWLPYRLRGIEQ